MYRRMVSAVIQTPAARETALFADALTMHSCHAATWCWQINHNDQAIAAYLPSHQAPAQNYPRVPRFVALHNVWAPCFSPPASSSSCLQTLRHSDHNQSLSSLAKEHFVMASIIDRKTPRSRLAGPSFIGLRAASAAAKRAARGASKKAGTQCELQLRHAIDQLGLHYSVACDHLPGRPDFVFWRARIVVFCDGDFWHGKNLQERLERLATGHNAPYWIAKIKANVARDRRQRRALRKDGWQVLRFWESQIRVDAAAVASKIERAIEGRAVDRSRPVHVRPPR